MYIRRADNQYSDFYADSYGVLGTSIYGTGTSLTSWLGGQNGYVVKWYDQSGLGYDMSQNNTSYQPQIITTDSDGICLKLTNTYVTQGTLVDQLQTGTNPFGSSSISNMHSIFTGKMLSFATGTPTSTYTLFHLNAPNQAYGATRNVLAIDTNNPPVFTFDAANYTTNRASTTYSSSNTNVKFCASCYKNSTTVKNGMVVTINGTTYGPNISSTNTAAPTNIASLNWGDSACNAHLYTFVLFSTPLGGTTDETILQQAF